MSKKFKKPKRLSPYQQFKKKWKGCDLCELCFQRNHMVMARGKIPCDVLFVGEAPGQSEDVLAKPFIGPAGKLLDKLVAEAVPSSVRCCYTNLVCCFPREAKDEGKNEPPDQCVQACQDRLIEFFELCAPELVVALGRMPEKWLPKILNEYEFNLCSLTHPAALLRTEKPKQGMLIQRTIVTLRDAIEEHIIPF